MSEAAAETGRIVQSLTTDRTITELAEVFGPLATILVCIGLYGVVSYAVKGRTSEIGIRMALGAQRNSVLWLTLRESLLLIVIGVGIGMPAIFGAGQWIASLLVGVKTTNIAALSSAAAILFGAAILACYIPARRATRVEPSVALSYE